MSSRPWNSRPVGPNKLTCFPLSGPFKVREFSVGLSKHGALLLFCLAFSCPSPGQDIDPDLITAEELRSARNQNITLGVPWGKFLPAPETLASDLLEDYELVADGEFNGLPESSPEELRILKRETVLVQFRIHKLYKGTEPEAIDIELDNDMLIVPGEGISRGGKRRRILDEVVADVGPELEQSQALVWSLEAGEIDRQEYKREKDRLDAIVAERIGREDLVDRAVIGPTHGKTFYHHEGAIRPNEKYLLGLNRTPHRTNVYGLHEFGNSSRIYWGEMRDYVLSALTVPPQSEAP